MNTFSEKITKLKNLCENTEICANPMNSTKMRIFRKWINLKNNQFFEKLNEFWENQKEFGSKTISIFFQMMILTMRKLTLKCF